MLKETKYIWEWPVRFYHWLNVLLIVALLLTGFYIGRPVFSQPGEATNYFLMGWMVLIHKAVAWLFIANMIFRLYWTYAGNEYAKFKPWRKGFIKDGIETFKYYSFLKKEHTLHHGHNVLAQLTYFFIIWIGSIIMVLTGFALQGEINPTGFQGTYFGWLVSLFGDSMMIRSLHHYVAWAFVWFIIFHLYTVTRQDILDEDGTISASISGYKFVPVDSDTGSDESSKNPEPDFAPNAEPNAKAKRNTKSKKMRHTSEQLP